MPEASQIQFNYLVDKFYFPNRSFTKTFIQFLFTQEGKQISHINYIFCTDEYLVEINRNYLNHNTLTDIITFELSESSQPILSDVYISIDRLKDNANRLKVPFYHELLRVVFHGALHLCGYKDKAIIDKAAMTAKEDYYLELFLVSRGTQP